MSDALPSPTLGDQTHADPADFLRSLLSPQVEDFISKLKNGNCLLAHYTSAENAINILKSENFWLRSARCMNDYSEIEHGLGLLIRCFDENGKERLKRLYSIFDKVIPGPAEIAVDKFSSWIPTLPDQIFIGCLSIFDPKDTFGRLSMWRAYSANGSGVALLMNSTAFLEGDVGIMSSIAFPVSYFTDVEFVQHIDESLQKLECNIASLMSLSSDEIENMVFWWLVELAAGVKHPGFVEEKEVRIIYIPKFGQSPVIDASVEVVRGVPQRVYKLRLDHDPDNGLVNANVSDLVQTVLVGPTEFPTVISNAFAAILAGKGVDNASTRVKVSNIPLR